MYPCRTSMPNRPAGQVLLKGIKIPKKPHDAMRPHMIGKLPLPGIKDRLQQQPIVGFLCQPQRRQGRDEWIVLILRQYGWLRITVGHGRPQYLGDVGLRIVGLRS